MNHNTDFTSENEIISYLCQLGKGKSEHFPTINHKEEVDEAIQGCHEFASQSTHGITFSKYKNAMSSTFPAIEGVSQKKKRRSLLRREVRGIAFDEKSKKCVIRRFHKFFNINERGETRLEKIDFSQPFVVLEKLDGSCIASCYKDKKIYFCTMMSIENNHCKAINDHLEKSPKGKNYQRFAKMCAACGFTPLYEWTSPENKIVIPYTTSTLTILAMRHIVHGHYVPFDHVVAIARFFGLPVVKAVARYPKGLTSESPTTFMTSLQSQSSAGEPREGFVIAFANGLLFKVKTLYYSNAHGINSYRLQEHKVWKAIADNVLDDILGSIQFSEQTLTFLRSMLSKVQQAILSTTDRLVGVLASIATHFDSMKAYMKQTKGKGDAISNPLQKRLLMEVFPKENHGNAMYTALCDLLRSLTSKKSHFSNNRDALYALLSLDRASFQFNNAGVRFNPKINGHLNESIRQELATSSSSLSKNQLKKRQKKIKELERVHQFKQNKKNKKKK